MASKEKEHKVIVPKTAAEKQRFKLEKLIKKAELGKTAVVPDRPEDKLPRVFNPPEFIRNIWGSSAGAGSGDFHVYRGVRRRENARQKFINEQAVVNEKNEEYLKKVVENQKQAEERTAKKRAKRQKKKMNQKAKKAKVNGKPKGKEEDEESEEDEEEDDIDNQEAQPECSVKQSENKVLENQSSRQSDIDNEPSGSDS